MTDGRTGRELTPRPEDQDVTPVLDREASPERFYAGDRVHTVGLTEERAAKVVRQSGNARSISFLAVLFIAIFVPIYWFYDIGIPALGAEGRLAAEADVQYVVDVERGYALYLANCARCHGEDGEGGIGPPLNDQAKLYNAVTADGLPGQGHLNSVYLERVLEVGGRLVCGDPNSQMPAWEQPAGPLNYRQIEELIAWLTASSEVEFVYDPAAHGEGGGEEEAAAPETVTGWRDADYQPPPDAPSPPPCWRNPSGVIGGGGGGGGGGASLPPIESPGTAEAPRVIELVETAALSIQDAAGAPVSALPVVAGEVVQFEVTNEAGFAHNLFVGPAEALESNATSGLPGVGDFVEGTMSFGWEVPADATGLQFACTIPGHYAPMHGDIVVQEP